MKLNRCLLALTVVCALSGMAKADPIDFHMVVVDDNPTFTTTSIVTPPVSVTFSACVTGEIGSGALGTYDGCASFKNATGVALTSLEMIFPDTTYLASQPSNCSPDGGTGYVGPNQKSIDFFQSSSCSIKNGNYVLDFTNGNIAPDQYFTVAESGVPFADFPTGTLSVNVTPEPSSIWLLSTGAMMLGALFYSKRS